MQVVAAQPVAVSPAALTMSAGGTQTFTATPAAGVTWSVDGLVGGDCVTPAFNSTTQCHGTISNSGVYIAPLSPPSGGDGYDYGDFRRKFRNGRGDDFVFLGFADY